MLYVFNYRDETYRCSHQNSEATSSLKEEVQQYSTA